MSDLPAVASIPELAVEVHKLLQHPLRHEILLRLGDGPATPGQLAKVTGKSERQVYDQINVLKSAKPALVELVEKRRGPRGGWEHVYKAVERRLINAEEWEQLPAVVKATSETTITRMLHGEMIRALEDGCFYLDPDHVLIRFPMWLDREGIQEVDSIFRRALEEAADAERKSAERRHETGEAPIRVIAGLTSFVAAPADRAAPRY